MISLLAIASVLLLIVVGLPVSISLALGTIIGLVAGGYDLILLPQQMAASVKSIELTAIPFVLMAASLMNNLGMTRKIFTFAEALVGHVFGGMGHANVVAGFIFSGISGAAVADAAALASVSTKEMPKLGYSKEFAAAIVVAVSTLGGLIPPSIMMVVYAITANVSVARLFLAGLGPAVLISSLIMALIWVLTRFGFTPSPAPSPFSWSRLARAGVDAALPLVAPIVIMRGVVTGFATPTQAAVLAVTYALIVGLIQRKLTWKIVMHSLQEAVEQSAIILYVIAISSGLSYLFVAEGTAAQLSAAMTSMSIGPVSFLIIANIILFALGCVVETLPAMLLAVPLLLPTAIMLGVDPVHFGVIVIFNLLIGYMHPPMGIGLFILMSIAKVEFVKFVKASLPFIGVLVFALMMLTFFPQLTLWLPNKFLPVN